MKTFTKILALLIALMMVVSMFAACADKADKNDDKNPPAGDTNPPDDGGTTTPPDDGGTTTPPDDGGTTTPPDDGGTTNPPDDPKPPVDEDTSYVYNPKASALATTSLDYGWGSDEMTLDFTDSKIVRVKVAEIEEAIANVLTDKGADKFTDRVLKIAGADTFALPGFTAEQDAALFTANYTYTFTIEYYAKAAGTMSIVVLTADGEREVFAAADCKEGANTLTFDFTVAEGDKGIAFKTTAADAEIYIGRLMIELYTYGPTYSQLGAGYTFDWSKDVPADANGAYGIIMQVKDIEDADAKAAILAAGKAEDDYIVTAPPAGIPNWQATPMSQNHYVEGRKYTVEVTYYTKNGGGASWFLVLDGTSGNHGIKSGMFSTTGQVATSSCVWECTKNDHTAVWYSAPSDVYIIDLKLTLDTSVDYHYKREDAHYPTADEIANRYTFDFSEGNIPMEGSRLWIDVENLSEELQAVLTAENGFGDSVIHITQSAFRMDAIDGVFATDTKYKFTARIYSANGKVGGFLLLPFNAQGSQSGSDSGSATLTPVEGAPAGVYDATWEILANEVTTTAGFYGSPAEEFYIGSITVTPGDYVEPDPLPEEGTVKFEGDDVAAKAPPTNTYGSWAQGSPVIVVDTPDEVKAAMGDKIGDKAVKIVPGASGNASFWSNSDFKLDRRNGKVGYKVTIELYVESYNNDAINCIFNGATNDFVSFGGIVEGANTIVLDYCEGQGPETWNISIHQGDLTGYVGDITIETYHIAQ